MDSVQQGGKSFLFGAAARKPSVDRQITAWTQTCNGQACLPPRLLLSLAIKAYS